MPRPRFTFSTSPRVVPSPVMPLSPDAGTTPSTRRVFTRGGHNAVRVWVGDVSYSQPWLDLYVLRGGESTRKVRLYAWSGRVIRARDSGDWMAFATTASPTTAIQFSTFRCPDLIQSTSAGVTGTAACDRAGPPLWSPSAPHLLLPSYGLAFQVNGDGTERWIFVSENDGRTWTNPRAVLVPASGSVKVLATYSAVALANYAGTAVSITAPGGSYVGGESATMSLPIPVVTGTTRVVSTVAEFNTARGLSVAGDCIRFNPGTYALDLEVIKTSFTANNGVGGRLGAEGILFEGATSDRADVILTGNGTGTNGRWNLDHGGNAGAGASLYTSFKNLTFSFTGINTGQVLVQCGKWYFQNVRVTGVASTVTDGLSAAPVAGAGGGPVILDALFCRVDNSSEDCWNFAGAGVGAAETLASKTRLIASDGDVAGTTNDNQQVLTTHFSLPVEVYGGTFSDARFNVFGNDNDDLSTIYAFFATTSAGTRKGSVSDSNLFGCNVTLGSTSALNTNTNGFHLFNNITVTGFLSSETLFRIASTTPTGWIIEHNRITSSSGAGRLFFPSVGGFSLKFNHVSGFSEGVRVGSYVSGSTAATDVHGNTFSSSPLTINDATLPVSLRNNAFTSPSGTQIVAGGATTTGSFNTYRSQTGYTAGTDDSAGTNAALEADLSPTPGGNCDNNGDSTIVDYVGGSDVYGAVLFDGALTPRGVRNRPAATSTSFLHNDVWR